MALRNYKFGLLPPTHGVELVNQQMIEAHRFYNKLIELERNRRSTVAQAIGVHGDVAAKTSEVTALKQQIETLDAVIKGRRKQARTSVDATRDEKSQKKLLGTQLKAARTELRAIKSEATKAEGTQAKIKEAGLHAKNEMKRISALSPVYWGTKGIIFAAVEAAAKSITPPDFKPWKGEGSIAVQVQTQADTPNEDKFTTDKLTQPNALVMLKAVTPAAYERTYGSQPRLAGRRTLSRSVLALRVGSTEKRKPVFAEFPIILHRTIPKGLVKAVRVWCENIGSQQRWYAMIVVDVEESELTRTLGKGVAGVDVGWRALENGDLRVAMIADDAGHVEELRLPASLLEKDAHARGIRSLRDKLLDDLKPAVERLLRDQEVLDHKGKRMEAQYVSLWRNPARVSFLMRERRTQVPDDLQVLFATFLKTNKHLHDYEAFETRKVRNQRKSIYENFAARMRGYAILGVEDIKVAELTVRIKDKPESGVVGQFSTLNRQKSFAASGLLLQLLKERTKVVEVPAAYTTKTCNSCGQIDVWEDKSAMTHTCTACGVTWDRDENGAKNICARAPVVLAEAQALAAANPVEKPKKSARRQRFIDGKARATAGARGAEEKLSKIA